MIADPPSYQKSGFVATKDYARLLRRLPTLLAAGGHVLLCLNAPELSMTFLHDLLREHAPRLSFVERVANPPVFADVDKGEGIEGWGLSVLFLNMAYAKICFTSINL